MGCNSSLISQKFDPLAEYEDTWFNPKRGEDPLDKLLVWCSPEVLVAKKDYNMPVFNVEIVNGQIDTWQGSKVTFGQKGANKEGVAFNIMMFPQGNNCKRVQFSGELKDKDGQVKLWRVPVDIPAEDEGWVHVDKLDFLRCDKLPTLKFKVSIKKEDANTLITTPEDTKNLNMWHHDFKLSNGEEAVIVYKQRTGNTKCLMWFPGRNDTFSHPHFANRLLEAGFDLYVIEHRKQGRSLIGCSSKEFELSSHTENFREYLEEHNKVFDFAFNDKPYEKCVVYAHSTGGLEAALYMREGNWRNAINALILNSPFLDFGQGGPIEKLLDSMDNALPLLQFIPGAGETRMIETPGKKANAFGLNIWAQYDVDLRCRNFITERMTLGYLSAVGKMHEELAQKKKEWTDDPKKACKVPTLLLWTDGDTCLDGSELQNVVGGISHDVEIKFIPNCRHDMLLNYTKEDNDKVMDTIFDFINTALAKKFAT